MTTLTERLNTDITTLTLGPSLGFLNGCAEIHLSLDGELISSCECKTGFVFRKIESVLTQRDWRTIGPLLDRIDLENSIFYEIAFFEALENISTMIVPDSVRMVRIILCELTRISAHLKTNSLIAKFAGFETPSHFMLRDREKILDLFELVSGVRFGLNFFSHAGLRKEVTDGFLQRTEDACEMIRFRVKEYNDLITYNHAFLGRLAFSGVLPSEVAIQSGLTGVNLRASGVSEDLRNSKGAVGYNKIRMRVPVGKSEAGVTGDTHARFLIRLREILASIEIIQQAIEILGHEKAKPRIEQQIVTSELPVGKSFSEVESPRGIIRCELECNGGKNIRNISFRTPSEQALPAVCHSLVGSLLEDLPLVFASFDLSISEIDR